PAARALGNPMVGTGIFRASAGYAYDRMGFATASLSWEMKLRIRGNSVRIRLSQIELEQLAEGGIAEDRIRFTRDAELAYRVKVAPGGDVRAELGPSGVTVTLPKASLDRWLDPEEVSIRAEQPIDDHETLAILVEKDFACLVPREGEDVSDLFPNPSRE